MRIEQKTITTLVAEEGKLLRRKSDGWVAGEQITLGYNYYEAGVGLSQPKMETPDDYEEIPIPDDYEVKPIINQEKRLARITELLNREKQEFKTLGLTPAQMLTHKAFAPKWGEDDGFKEGDVVAKGSFFTYGGKLYAVLQEHTILPHYYPSKDTAALYVEVTPDYTEEGEELGTLENPIPYEGNMVLEEGKCYSQNGVVYLCTRDSVVALYQPLKDLLNLYVDIA